MTLALVLARIVAGPVSRRAAWALALLPLLFTGKAIVTGGLYGPSDLYYIYEPWKNVAAREGVAGVQNGILSDLAFANLPWRAAVREAVVNGRLPLWNRFVLAGNPLLGSGSAAVFHPSTWLGLFLPLAESWTFSCAFTLFLSLLCAYLFFRDFGLSELACLLGAVVWAFSTYMLFWVGWSVGLSTASFPLLLAGLLRLARGKPHGLSLTTAALLLGLSGGHPESLLHEMAAGGIYFLWELFRQDRRARASALRGALGAGVLALLLGGPVLFPLLEAIPHSAEYHARQSVLDSGRARQSVAAAESARRLLPDLLPFAHGIFGRSPVQDRRADGSGMPFGYCGALVFPLAAIGLFSRQGRREGGLFFLTLTIAGLLAGASAPGLMDLLGRLPGFRLALNYRLVFLAAFGFAGLAALGAEEIRRNGTRVRLAAASLATALLVAGAAAMSRGILRERALPANFVRASFLAELLPLVLLAAASLALPRSRRRVVAFALLLLAGQRWVEMRGTYPTLSSGTLAPGLSELAALPSGGEPYRIVATGETLRPNSAALYGLEDVRGYESIMLDRFADTFPLWCRPQRASFNRVDDLRRPFLQFLGARFAILPPGAKPPPGWIETAAGSGLSVAANPNALPRAFVPRTLRFETDAAVTLAEMRDAADFAQTAWIRSAAATPGQPNGDAALTIREAGPDLVVAAEVQKRVFIATSLPDWPGWSVTPEHGGRALPTVTVNHAFVGFWLAPGKMVVRLRYRPFSFRCGLWGFGLGALLVALSLKDWKRPRSRRAGVVSA